MNSSRDGKRCVKLHIAESLNRLLDALSSAERRPKQAIISEAIESKRDEMIRRLAEARKMEKF